MGCQVTPKHHLLKAILTFYSVEPSEDIFRNYDTIPSNNSYYNSLTELCRKHVVLLSWNSPKCRFHSCFAHSIEMHRQYGTSTVVSCRLSKHSFNSNQTTCLNKYHNLKLNNVTRFGYCISFSSPQSESCACGATNIYFQVGKMIKHWRKQESSENRLQLSKQTHKWLAIQACIRL